MNKKIVIIGAGPAGIEAAATAARYSNDVTIITNSTVGESKLAHTSVWLHVVGAQFSIHPERLISTINEMSDVIQSEWEDTRRKIIQDLGVNIVYSEARFASPTRVEITDFGTGEQRSISADKIIIATGSRPIFPNEMTPDGQQIYSYHTLNQMKTLPKSMLVVGDGAIGFEAVNLFSRLDIDVIWIVPGDKPKSPIKDHDVDTFLIDEYKRRGVRIVSGQFVSKLLKGIECVQAIREDGSIYNAEKAFVTLGFRSNVDTMNVAAAGLHLNTNGSIDCDEYGRTAAPSIYIVGDAQMVIAAVYASAKARVAALHAIGEHVEPVSLSKIPLSFNEYPQVAAVGDVDDQNHQLTTRVYPLKKHNFLGLVLNKNDGFIKLFLNQENIIVGGSVVGYCAKELISTITLLIDMKSTMDQAATFYGTHPSTSEVLFHSIRHFK